MSAQLPDDTALDAIAAQVRSIAALPDEEVGRLLTEARDDPGGAAGARLVEQTLGAVLAGVLARARRVEHLELMDLYQEGSVAATVAVAEYAERGGATAGFRPYVARVVDGFLDAAVEREEAQRAADAALVARVELLQAAQVTLRRQLEREPTTLELAGVLEWPPEQVELLAGVLAEATSQYDAEILEYLDDADTPDDHRG